VTRRLTVFAGSENTDVPALFGELLRTVGVVDNDAEIAVSSAVVLVFLTGEVAEQDVGVFNDDVINGSVRHKKSPLKY
jgi:hypothetical protein